MGEVIYLICAGHENHITPNCIDCSPDYDKNHFPNNFDCPKFQRGLKAKYDLLEKALSERGVNLTDNVKNMITTHLSLINMLNPDKEITDEQIINGILQHSNEKRRSLSICDEFLDIAGLKSFG